MTAPKAKTMIERAGFVDRELTTPGHDALMLWIDEYVPEIMTDVFQFSEAPMIRSKKWEPAILDKRGFVLGHADMAVSMFHQDFTWKVFIEAKPNIGSLGELMRQLRYYQSGGDFSQYYNVYNGRVEWLIISPDDRFSEMIRQQGV